MDLSAKSSPLKLGPLPPLQGSTAKGGLKALPPLKKQGSLSGLGTSLSLSESPKGSPKTVKNVKASLSLDKTDSPVKKPSSTPKAGPEKGLSLKLGGANFLKPEAKELLESDYDTDNSSVPKIINSVPKENVKSILKSSPSKKQDSNYQKKAGLRLASPASNSSSNSSNIRGGEQERRIQFHIEEKKDEAKKEDQKFSLLTKEATISSEDVSALLQA